MLHERTDGFCGGCVPKPRRAVAARRDHPPAVGTETSQVHLLIMVQRFTHHLASGSVPDACIGIVRYGKDLFAIWAESDVSQLCRMLEGGHYFSASVRIPNPDRAILARGGHTCSIRRKCGLDHLVSMSQRLADKFAGLNVPYSRAVVL